MTTKKKYPRTPLGRWSLDLCCPFCGANTADGLLDRNGMAYLSCRSCRTRALSCGLRGVLSARFLGNLLRDPQLRQQWAVEIAKAEADLQRPVAQVPIQPVQATPPAPVSAPPEARKE